MSDNDPVYTYELKPMPAVPCIWQRHLWPHVPLGPLGTHPDTEVRALADGSLEFDVTTDGVKTRYTSSDEGETWGAGEVSEPLITHEAAAESLQRFIDGAFGGGATPRLSIPARPDHDDDLILSRYIAQQRAGGR